MNRDVRLTRSRWVEAALTLALGVAVLLLLRRPQSAQVAALFLALFTAISLGLIIWQYRIMDEFRRARFLKAWAVAGVTGFISLSSLIAWGVLTWPGRREELQAAPPAISFTFTDLYFPWTATLLAFLLATAFLYRRDTRAA